MIKKLKEIAYFLFPILVIVWIVYINRFPSEYVYNSGDFSQPINLSKHFNELFYTWGSGISAPGEGGPFSWFAASPYYFAFYLVPTFLGLNDSQNLSFVLFCFLFLSYISFYVSQKLLFKKQVIFYDTLFPLLYSINMTTLYFFTYTWGFSHHVFLYITLPIIISTLYLILHKFELKYLLLYLIALMASIPGFTNPAFFIGLVLILFLFLLGLIALRSISITKFLLYKIAIISITSLLALSFWIIPTIPLVSQNMSQISGGVFNLTDWLVMQSSDILSIIIGLPGYQGFPPFSHEQIAFYFLPFISLITLIYLLSTTEVNIKNSKVLKMIIVLLLIEMITFIILKKAKPPFGTQTLYLFSIPFLSTFRSYEKIAIFLPFINLISIYGLLSLRNFNTKLITIAIALMLLAPFPFLLGGIQTKYSITIGSDKSKDYKNAEYSGLVKIPNDYYETANYLNNIDKSDTKIQSLPFSPLNTTAWVNFPKWKLIGFNITDYLFDKPILATNSSQYMLENWIPQEELNHTNLDPIWYIRLLSYFNVSHITYQFAVSNEFIFQSIEQINSLTSEEKIENLLSNKSLRLLKLPESNILPKFYIPKKIVVSGNQISYFPYILTQKNYLDRSLFIFSTADNIKYKNIPVEIESINFLEKTDTPKSPEFCSGSCFKITEGYKGTYVLQISTEGFDLDEIRPTSINIFEVINNTNNHKTIFTENLDRLDFNPNYIDLGEFIFKDNKSYYISVIYKPNINMLISGEWQQSEISTAESKLVYKEVDNCKANRTYSFNNSSEEQTRPEYILAERIPDFRKIENDDITEYLDKKIELPTTFGTMFEGQENTTFSPIYSIKNVCRVFINKNDVDNFRNIQIYPDYSSKLIIKSSIQKDDTIITPEITISKINPTKYKLLISKTTTPYFLVFNESYNDEWGVFKNDNKKDVEISKDTHFVSNGFSNGWIINPNEVDSQDQYTLTIEYKPQKRFKLGLILSLIPIIILSTIILIKNIFKKHHEI